VPIGAVGLHPAASMPSAGSRPSRAACGPWAARVELTLS